MTMKKGGKVRFLAGLAGATAIMAASIVPAQADPWRGYGYSRYGGGYYGSSYRYRGYRPYRHYHRHDRGLDAGDVIGIAALIGAVAVIASSANKNKRDSRYPDRRDDDRGYDSSRDDYSSSDSQDEAVNACASAAREEAERGGGYAEIREVEEPRESGNDGWRVQGSLEQRRNYQDKRGLQKSFTCTYENGRVAQVDVRDYTV